MLRRLPNLTNALVLSGVAALGIMLLVPGHTAARAAKVETRAEEAGRALLAVALEREPSGSLTDAEPEMLEPFVAACAAAGHPSSYLPTALGPSRPASLEDLDCALFESKHYCFMVVRGIRPPEPEPEAETAVGSAEEVASRPTESTADSAPSNPSPESRATDADTVEPRRDPLEVYAWPKTLQPPGHTAFFFPEIGDASFSRNLMHQYVGWDESRRRAEIPRPGAGVPKKARSERAYRGLDDERWLVFL